jgi:TPR repeat protein
MHTAFITGLKDAAFPPEYPFYPGHRLSYPFLTDSLSTTFYLFGLSLQAATILPAVLMFILLAIGVMLLGRGLTAGKAAAVIAAVTGGLIWRNARISQENRELNFDIYGAALRSLKLDESLQPEELAFLEASAQAGNTEAMVLLGDCCQNGWGAAPDGEKAFRWFQQAAEQGNTQGMIGLGNCYLHGVGTEPDPAQVFQWNLRAAEAGDPSGMLNAASCYEEGFGTEKNAALSLEWYQKSAEAGYELGMYHLSRCYRAGIGTEADPKQAFRWMKKLAETGNTSGMYNTALMYQNGYGTPENPEEAYRWYRKAAEAGDPDAMWMTGACIESRYGVADPALDWYERAAAAGNAAAANDAERLRTALTQKQPEGGSETASPSGTDHP